MVRVIIAILIAGFIGLVALGYWTDRGTKDGVPVNSGTAAEKTYKSCGNNVFVPTGEACPGESVPTPTPTVNTGDLKSCGNNIYVPQDANCPSSSAEKPGGDESTTKTDQACLAGDKVIISRSTLDLDKPGFMVVDYYLQGDPQGVTTLSFDGTNGGSYALKDGTRGAYWIWPASCTFDEVVDAAKDHAKDLYDDGYNMMSGKPNYGYQAWESSGFFVKK